jgi:hypothetical protein
MPALEKKPSFKTILISISALFASYEKRDAIQGHMTTIQIVTSTIVEKMGRFEGMITFRAKSDFG